MNQTHTQPSPLSWWRKNPLSQKGKKSNYREEKLSGYSTYMTQPGKAVWSPRNYEKFADEAYTKNVIAYRAISIIAR